MAKILKINRREFLRKLNSRKDETSISRKEITPIKGIDYFTSDEVEAFKREITPVKGRDYFDGKVGKIEIALVVPEGVKMDKFPDEIELKIV